MCAFGGNYSLIFIGYHQRELLQNFMPRTVSREMPLVRKNSSGLIWTSSRNGCPVPAELTLLYEWRIQLSVNHGNSVGDALVVIDGKRRRPPTVSDCLVQEGPGKPAPEGKLIKDILRAQLSQWEAPQWKMQLCLLHSSRPTTRRSKQGQEQVPFFVLQSLSSQ